MQQPYAHNELHRRNQKLIVRFMNCSHKVHWFGLLKKTENHNGLLLKTFYIHILIQVHDSQKPCLQNFRASNWHVEVEET